MTHLPFANALTAEALGELSKSLISHSIQLKSTPVMKFYTEENSRYHHGDISADEIALQK